VPEDTTRFGSIRAPRSHVRTDADAGRRSVWECPTKWGPFDAHWNGIFMFERPARNGSDPAYGQEVELGELQRVLGLCDDAPERKVELGETAPQRITFVKDVDARLRARALHDASTP
jgi:hypothetical protein